MPRAQIKDEKTYRKLRDEGESTEKSARIANAVAGSSAGEVGRRGGKSGSYDDWSKQDLVRRAREIGIRGRSTMSKAELIKARYGDLLTGSYDCVDRIVLNAYFSIGHNPGGFRCWWRRPCSG